MDIVQSAYGGSIGRRTQTLFQAANGILNARFAHCGSTMGVET